MLIPSIQGSLGLTPVFKCSLTKCYSTDGQGTSAGTHLLFLNLQRTLNRFAASAGFKQITVDGFIGSGTASAFVKAATWAMTRLGAIIADGSWTGAAAPMTARTQVASVIGLGNDKKALAGGAQQAYDALKFAADTIGLPGTATITPPAPDLPPTPPTPPTLPPMTTPPTFDPGGGAIQPQPSWARTNWPWLAAGVVLLTGLGAATYFVFKPVEEM